MGSRPGFLLQAKKQAREVISKRCVMCAGVNESANVLCGPATHLGRHPAGSRAPADSVTLDSRKSE